MKRALAVLLVLPFALPLRADGTAASSFATGAKRYVSEAASLAVAPAHWRAREWTRFGEGAAAVAALYAADRQLADAVQRNRNAFSQQFAKTITPFGGRRALDISALMLAGGYFSHNEQLREAGRDSLESELWAGGVVTPLLKRTFGRARPIQEEGAHSFHALSSAHQSFPSGHATNAFAFATGIAAHYDGWAVPTLVYSIASGVAISRVHDRAHFPSDVLAGALIGRAVAKGVVARHTHAQRVAWTVAPGVIARKPAVIVRLALPR